MKSIIVGDIHIGYSKNSEIFLETTRKFFLFLTNYIKTSNQTFDSIIFLGDIFDNQYSLDIRTKNIAIDLFTSLSSLNIPIKILLGNHDTYYNNTNKVHSLKCLYHIPNLEIIEEVTIKDNRTFVPWITDYSNPIPYNTDVVFGHFDIKGFNYNKTSISENGLEVDSFKKQKLVISGHYHTRSFKTIGNTTILFLGTPYQLNRGDADEDRGFLVLDDLNLTFVENEESPKFVSITYPEKLDREFLSGNFVDLFVDYDSEEFDEKVFDKYKKAIESCNPVKLDIQKITKSKVTETIDVIDLKDISSTNQLLSEYAFKKYKDDEVKAERITNKLMDLYRKVI